MRVIEAVNLSGGWAMFSDGVRAQVWLLDIDHERTADLEQAVSFIVYAPITPDGPVWFEADIDSIPKATVH